MTNLRLSTGPQRACRNPAQKLTGNLHSPQMTRSTFLLSLKV
ncbi:unnamed protein product [Gulo gulo]|uniref:Uncharacterized protein n=1 Tax=Gulo gulo TaxID=48420 RepID=A0A9X9LJY6_GULGU|nr:unnamed protein product [Gulo gulo]